MNQIVVVGRLTKDPETRYAGEQKIPVATFTVAVDRLPSGDKPAEADFIPVVTWRSLAEHCANYLKKGRLVAVSGRLQIRTYDDKEGNKRKIAEIVADQVKFLERPKNAAAESAAAEAAGFGGAEVSIGDDELPF